MAFTPNNFIGDSQSNKSAPRIWRYRTEDDLIDTIAVNYFGPASTVKGGMGLMNFDVILTQASDGTAFLLVVVNNEGISTTVSANFFA